MSGNAVAVFLFGGMVLGVWIRANVKDEGTANCLMVAVGLVAFWLGLVLLIYYWPVW